MRRLIPIVAVLLVLVLCIVSCIPTSTPAPAPALPPPAPPPTSAPTPTPTPEPAPPMPSPAVPETVVFPDDNLETEIRDALGKPLDEAVTAAELARLTTLNASKRGIADLSDIEYCANLVKLDLSHGYIKDLSPLSALTKLTELNLSGNMISDISPLTPLTSLTWLDLSANRIRDISPLLENSGLSEGDMVWLENNILDLSEGSEDLENIRQLEGEGVVVYYETVPPPASLPAPTPSPKPAPVPEQPQVFEVYLKPGAVVGATFSISKVLEVGEEVNGFIEICDTESHSTDYSRYFFFEVLNPEEKTIYSWEGNYRSDNNHEFSFDVSDTGKYIIKITHHSNYRKTLYVKILPPGWTSEK